MMKTVTLRKEQIYQGDLLLVNARHPYRDNSRKFYVSLNSRYEETLLSREAANALQLIFQKISSGNAIVPVSGYRTLEEQVNIYILLLLKITERSLHESMLLCQITANIKQDLRLI